MMNFTNKRLLEHRESDPLIRRGLLMRSFLRMSVEPPQPVNDEAT